MKQWYRDKNFSTASMSVINKANEIIEEYVAQGFILTLRQIYYQFVARDLLPNIPQSYKRLGGIVSDGRLAGLIDWRYIEDRTRAVRSNTHWDGPEDIIKGSADGYEIDKWQGQPTRCEVWIEKDALVGVIEGVCREEDVPHFSCRGYSSQSAMHRAGNRLLWHENQGSQTVIFHLGDHDPSGLDMTRDIEDRLAMFGSRVDVRRIALNMDQIEEHNPPPNPAKVTDSRAEQYILEHGDESWELDSLEPSMLVDLVRDSIREVREQSAWDGMVEQENEEQELLAKTVEHWDEVVEFLEDFE